MSAKWLVALFLVGAAAGYGASNWATNKQVARLKVTADSIRVVDSVQTARATAFADSVAHVVTVLHATEAAAKERAAQAATSVNVFHDALHAAIADNEKAQVAFESLEAAHATREKSLQDALVAADAQVAAEHAVNDTLRAAIGDLNRSVAFLAGKVNALHAGTTPKWLKVSFEVVKIGGAFIAGTQVKR